MELLFNGKFILFRITNNNTQMTKQITNGNWELESADKNKVEIFIFIGHTSDPTWKTRIPVIISLSNNFREYLHRIDTLDPEKLSPKLGTDKEQIETIKGNLNFVQEAVYALSCLRYEIFRFHFDSFSIPFRFLTHIYRNPQGNNVVVSESPQRNPNQNEDTHKEDDSEEG